MKTSESTKAVFKAIHDLQQELEIVKRGDTANIGEKYSYKYASMPKIWVEVKPLLKKYNLTVIQSPTQSQIGDSLTTMIVHDSGEYIQDTMRLVLNREDAQGIGSAITYAKRYALSAMLGVVTDDDNDATTQRMADGEMKKEWVRAYKVIAKKQNPDAVVTNNDFIKFIEDTYGKHPTRILAKEHQQVLDIIKAFDE